MDHSGVNHSDAADGVDQSEVAGGINVNKCGHVRLESGHA